MLTINFTHERNVMSTEIQVKVEGFPAHLATEYFTILPPKFVM